MAAPDRDMVLFRSMSEAQFQRQVITWAKRGGWLVYHVHDSREQEWGTDKGFPDIVLAKPGQPLWIPELKSETGRLSLPQKLWLDTLNASHTHYAPIWRPSDGDRVRGLLCGQ